MTSTEQPETPVPDTVPWQVAIDVVCEQFATYANWRLVIGDIEQCARLAQISDATADRFEKTLLAISETPENEAVPADATAETADPAHSNQ